MKKLMFLVMILSIGGLVLFSCSERHPTEPGDISGAPRIEASGQEKVDVLIGVANGRMTSAVTAAGGEIKHQYQYFPIIFASVPEASLSALSQNPDILYVEPNMTRNLSAQTLDWGVDRVDAEYVAGNSGYTGAGIDVAILDTGGDMDHPDLTWAGGHDFAGRNPANWDDKNGHGTHCAGIISADNNGIGVVGAAPGADVWALKVGRSNPNLNLILEAADWCIATHYDGDPDNDIKIMSMSYGGGYSSAEDQAMQACYDEGILLVAAAGNSSGSVSYPAALSSVMAVSASTSSDGFASYSNYGSQIEVVAPGSSIYSTYKGGGYRTLSGTSMACPMVVGTAALAWEAHSGYSNSQIRNLLQSSAQDIGLPSNKQGSGLVDAEKAALGTTNGDDYSGGGGGGSGSMHVASIDFGQKKKGPSYDLLTYVTIHTDDHTTPVVNVYVTATVHHVGGNDYNFGGYTDDSGRIKFTLRGASQGMSFDATVTGVSKDGWTYDSGANHETSDSYTIQ